MKKILSRLINHETISKQEAYQTLINISNGAYNPSQIASFLTIYMMRGITIEELEGFRDALLELCISVKFEQETIDLCGTGGDGKDSFNISTLASFVAAGAGVFVSKHGNYGVSSACGSSNVMEYLGIRFTNDADFLQRCLNEANICFLHAQLFHPAMKQVAPIRKELGVKTFFNMLGPMVNPAFPKFQMVGVFNLEMARIFSYLYQQTEKKYTILTALDGYDEISLTGGVKIIRNDREEILYPADFQSLTISPEAILGGKTIAESASIFMNVLEGKGTLAQQSVVIANAAMAISTATQVPYNQAISDATESLLSGKALQSFQKLVSLSSK